MMSSKTVVCVCVCLDAATGPVKRRGTVSHFFHSLEFNSLCATNLTACSLAYPGLSSDNKWRWWMWTVAAWRLVAPVLAGGYSQDCCSGIRNVLRVQQTLVQKQQTHLLRSFSFQFWLETIYCLCCHRMVIWHIPPGYYSMRKKELSNIFIASTFGFQSESVFIRHEV